MKTSDDDCNDNQQKMMEQLIDRASRVSNKISDIYIQLKKHQFIGKSRQFNAKLLISVSGDGKPRKVTLLKKQINNLNVDNIEELIFEALNNAYDQREKYIEEKLTELQRDEEIFTDLLYPF